ncbi:MAG: RNA-binding protein [Bacteroidetes bacterium]|nr:MAG: RNA-binding protein [Bacteroidota bacterium]
MNIYVGNLSYKVTESDLMKEFGQYGEVTSVKLISDKYTGQSKGFGFVVMDNKDEAIKAIKGLNGKEMDNREIAVNEARPKRDNFFRNDR